MKSHISAYPLHYTVEPDAHHVQQFAGLCAVPRDRPHSHPLSQQQQRWNALNRCPLHARSLVRPRRSWLRLRFARTTVRATSLIDAGFGHSITWESQWMLCSQLSIGQRNISIKNHNLAD